MADVIYIEQDVRCVRSNRKVVDKVTIHGPGYKLPSKGVRRLHIDGVEYLYKITGFIVLFYLEGRKVVTDISAVSRKSWDLIERGQWKMTSDGHVTPAHCKEFLTRFLAEYP